MWYARKSSSSTAAGLCPPLPPQSRCPRGSRRTSCMFLAAGHHLQGGTLTRWMCACGHSHTRIEWFGPPHLHWQRAHGAHAGWRLAQDVCNKQNQARPRSVRGCMHVQPPRLACDERIGSALYSLAEHATAACWKAANSTDARRDRGDCVVSFARRFACQLVPCPLAISLQEVFASVLRHKLLIEGAAACACSN